MQTSRKEKQAQALAAEAAKAQTRAANAAAMQKQDQTAEMTVTRRASQLGKAKQLSWLPLGTYRSKLGSN
jgi:hypothetical protein